MIRSIEIKNFKSIKDAKIDLGRVNLFIGENGAGKSNILEAIAFAGAAGRQKLDNEYLAARGIRVVHPQFMSSAFKRVSKKSPSISISIDSDEDGSMDIQLTADAEPYSPWKTKTSKGAGLRIKSENSLQSNLLREKLNSPDFSKMLISALRKFADDPSSIHQKQLGKNLMIDDEELSIELTHAFFDDDRFESLKEFIIFSPEISSLREFFKEGQILPLGISGEGLFKLLGVMSTDKDHIDDFLLLKEYLRDIIWFEDFKIEGYDSSAPEKRLLLTDKFLTKQFGFIDNKIANEGFLFLIFYYALLISSKTPKFFAIDNIDASLNPKLCIEVVRKIVELSKERNKQVILTTHNPAVLDGLNLLDDDQRIFVVSRSLVGHTEVRRLRISQENLPTIPLSQAFMSGLLGGLPKGF